MSEDEQFFPGHPDNIKKVDMDPPTAERKEDLLNLMTEIRDGITDFTKLLLVDGKRYTISIYDFKSANGAIAEINSRDFFGNQKPSKDSIITTYIIKDISEGKEISKDRENLVIEKYLQPVYKHLKPEAKGEGYAEGFGVATLNNRNPRDRMEKAQKEMGWVLEVKAGELEDVIGDLEKVKQNIQGSS